MLVSLYSVLHSRDEHGPLTKPGIDLPRAAPGRRLAARTFKNFRKITVVNFREIYYHFSVLASRQLIRASRGALRTQL